jgi:hypothetical protein
MKICSNYKNCIHKDCPFNQPYEDRQDDGPADCNGVEVEPIEISS